MLYMFLICYDPTAPKTPEDRVSRQPQHAELERQLREEGVYVSGAALMPPEVTPVVRVKDGKQIATDGPFAETRELVGGYFIIDCTSEDDVARYAARIPVNSRSWIDARRIALFHPDAARIASLG